jgi:hypothetical protein
MADAPRPLAVTVAGWVLIADAAISAVVILVNALADTPMPIAVRIAGTLTLLGVASFEAWIGRGVLNRRRWWLGIGFPLVFLVLGILFPPWADDPPMPPASLAYSIAAMLAWLFVVGALLWHRRRFSDRPREVATG